MPVDARAQVRYGLLGRRLAHSWSAQIHERLGSSPYELVELEPDELATYVREGSWEGLNVTIPYKRDVVRLADDASDDVRALGAANTLVRMGDGRIRAENTDLFGFSWMLGRFMDRHLGGGDALGGGEALFLGSGGAASSVCRALGSHGMRASVISRRGPDSYEGLARRHPQARLIVNATPVGMYPACPASPLESGTLAGLAHLDGVLDVIYNPARTALVLEGQSLGIPAEGGLAMLVAQAVRSSELWRSVTYPQGTIGEMEHELARAMGTVFLIGMPGCGKTSCGRELAHLTGRPFVDMDQAFLEAYGTSAARAIETGGEARFRDMETELLRDVAPVCGRVVACGGGIVCRADNLDLMRQAGTIVMLDRPVAELSSAGRPLSRVRGVEGLAAERMGLYRAWADVTIGCTGSPAGDARAVAGRLGL